MSIKTKLIIEKNEALLCVCLGGSFWKTLMLDSVVSLCGQKQPRGTGEQPRSFSKS